MSSSTNGAVSAVRRTMVCAPVLSIVPTMRNIVLTPHPEFISGSLRGLLPALYYCLKSLAPGFGALAFKTRYAPATPFVLLENLRSIPPPHWRCQHRSRHLSPCPRSTRPHPQFQAPLPPPAWIGVVSLVIVWPVLSAYRQHGARN